MKLYSQSILAVVVLMLIPISSIAEPAVSQVGGNCFLENADGTHEGTKVVFLAITPLAETDSCMTDSSGHFNIMLADGQYSVQYSHPNYISRILPDESGCVFLMEIWKPYLLQGRFVQPDSPTRLNDPQDSKAMLHSHWFQPRLFFLRGFSQLQNLQISEL